MWSIVVESNLIPEQIEEQVSAYSRSIFVGESQMLT
jgi:hypothetical protein